MAVMEVVHNTNISNDSIGNSSYRPENFVNPLSDPTTKIIFTALYVFVFICCIFGNITVLIVIIKTKRMRTRTNFFLANLAVADFCVGVFCILPNLSITLTLKWVLGRTMCKIYYFIENMSYSASILLLAVIAVERYVAIMHPLRSRRLFTSIRLQIAQICIWLIALGYNIPIIFIFDIHRSKPGGEYIDYCYFVISFNQMRILLTVNIILWYALPLGIMAVVYTRISLTLWSTSKSVLVQCRDTEMTNKTKVENEKKPCSCIRLNDSHSSDLDDKELTRVTCNTAFTENSSSSDTRHDKCWKSSIRNGNVNSSHDVRRSPGRVRYCLPNDKCKSGLEMNTTNNTGNQSLSPWQARRAPFCRQSPKHVQRDCLNSQKTDVAADMYSEVTFSEDTDSVRSRVSVRRPRTTRMSSRKALSSRRRVIKLLMTVLVTFAVCVLPHHLRRLLFYWNVFPSHNAGVLPPVSFLLLYLNSALNPVLYWLFSDSFRRSFKETFFCCKKTSNAGRYTIT